MSINLDLEKLFDLPHENLSTEFKGWLDLSDGAGRSSLAKAAIALANHGGGVIVMGMKEKSDHPPQSTKRPSSMPRYSSDIVNSAINKYSDPKFQCQVVHINHSISGHEHAFIVIPSGITVPVMAIRDHSGTMLSQRCYIRKPGPKSEEPFTAEEWRSLFRRCIQAERESMIDAIRNIIRGEALSEASEKQVDHLRQFATESRQKWVERISKIQEDSPARHKFGNYSQSFQIIDVAPATGLSDLKERMDIAHSVKLTGWGPFVNLHRSPMAPTPSGDCIECWTVDESNERDGRYSDYWRARPDGFLYQLRSFDEDFTTKVAPGTAIDHTMPVWRISETLLYISRLAKLFDIDPKISIQIEYSGLNGRTLTSLFDWRYSVHEGKCAADGVLLKGLVNASSIDDNLVEVIIPLLSPLYEHFDFVKLSEDFVADQIKKLRGKS